MSTLIILEIVYILEPRLKYTLNLNRDYTNKPNIPCAFLYERGRIITSRAELKFG